MDGWMDVDWVAECVLKVCLYLANCFSSYRIIMNAMSTTTTTTQYHSTNRWHDRHHDQDHCDDDHEHCHFHQSEPVACLSECFGMSVCVCVFFVCMWEWCCVCVCVCVCVKLSCVSGDRVFCVVIINQWSHLHWWSSRNLMWSGGFILSIYFKYLWSCLCSNVMRQAPTPNMNSASCTADTVSKSVF